MPRLLAALVSVLLLSACGTQAVDNVFQVMPVSGSLQVGVFDWRMGDTADWAGRTVGSATPDDPHEVIVPATFTRTIGQSALPPGIEVGVYLPEVSRAGFYSLAIDAADGRSQDVAAPFALWPDGPPDPSAPDEMRMLVTTEAADGGWRVAVTVQDPPNG